MSDARSPPGRIERRRIPAQRRRTENRRRRHMRGRLQDQIGCRRQLQIDETFAHPFGKAVPAMHEYRHIRPQRQPDAFELAARQSGLPEMIERQQHCCSVRRTAPQPATHRQVFAQRNAGALATSRMRLQHTGCTYGEISLLGHARRRRGKDDFSVRARREAQVVGTLDEAKNSLQQVVAIRATTNDMQE